MIGTDVAVGQHASLTDLLLHDDTRTPTYIERLTFLG